jgi:hypothetical protein
VTTSMVADWTGSQGHNNQLPRLRLYATDSSKNKGIPAKLEVERHDASRLLALTYELTGAILLAVPKASPCALERRRGPGASVEVSSLPGPVLSCYGVTVSWAVLVPILTLPT